MPLVLEEPVQNAVVRSLRGGHTRCVNTYHTLNGIGLTVDGDNSGAGLVGGEGMLPVRALLLMIGFPTQLEWGAVILQ